MYHVVFKLLMPVGMDTIVFADDITVAIVAKYLEKVTQIAHRVCMWHVASICVYVCECVSVCTSSHINLSNRYLLHKIILVHQTHEVSQFIRNYHTPF